MDEIRHLWRKHQQASFPADYRGEEIMGEDLVMLDSYTAGCISTFVGNGGRLDKKRHEVLIACRDGLAKVVPALAGEARKYYDRLLRLSDLILEHLRTDRA